MKTNTSAKRLKHLLKIVIINVAVLAILLELGSAGAYLIYTKEFFYARQPRTTHLVGLALPGQRGTNVNDNVLFQIHPYFGYVQKPTLDFRFPYSTVVHHPNNWGFDSEHDYPFKRQNEKQFIIGIFGGSVAQSVAMFELEHRNLTRILQQLPYLKDKEIIILSFTVGAYKQPQQLLILNYFLSLGQELDLVINIDGFNDIALSYLNHQNGIDTSMPNYLVIMPLVDLANKNLTTEEMGLAAEISNDKLKLSSADEGLKSCRLASSYVLRWLHLRLLTRKYNRDVQRFNALIQAKVRDDSSSLVRIYGKNSALSEAAVLEGIASMWATSSLLMKAGLDSKNSLYFHVLQPNQYHQTGRRFGEAEQKIAFGGASAYREGVIKGYPVLLSKTPLLRAANENFFDATRIFDQTPEAVYSDNCCHYNQAGNQLFAEYIAKSIVEVLAKQPGFGAAPRR